MIETSYLWRNANRHWRDRAIAWGAQRIAQPLLKSPADWPSHRRGFRLAAGLRRRPRGLSVRKIMLGSHGALEISPKAPERRLVWIHGGGFVVGSPETHLVMLSHLALAANALVIAPRYRLAPEDPFPRGARDVEEAVEHAQTWRDGIGPWFLGGDSAGGCLALVALAKLLAAGQSPRATVLYSPATAIDPDRPVPEANDLLFPESILYRIAEAYSAGAAPHDPRLSPIHAEFPGAPPALIQCAAGEFLEEDSDAIAARLASFGANVTLEKAELAPHVWQFMAGISPLADDAIRRTAAFMKAHS